ncbi:hypothetical protein HL657_12355 [Methanoculleus sp. YWC-01]|jgi:uncharacterized protein YndB with AHSA1/START domain|uniref:Epoxide hydrolase n=1 Tax=Methanoculleus nereidis TaxID=2735141 RepID=A0ABU3Z542_9EURY|nr:hypothetical protein [Methanoculleus sp. YWC-01]MDV4343941.1 hypothetical protein [Methanoculleus sp. YWC-01]
MEEAEQIRSEILVERVFDAPRGGHFGAMEDPELLANGIRALFRTIMQG